MEPSDSPLTPPRKIQDLSISPAPPLSIAFSSGGKRVLTSGLDFQLRLWDLENEACTHHWDARGPLYDIQVTPTGTTALLGAVQGVIRWDLAKWDLEQPNTLWSYSMINAVAYAASTGEVLGGGEDSTIHRWRLSTGEKLPRLGGHWITITALDISPSGLRAISADLYGQLRYWDLTKGACLQAWQGSEHKISAVELSPDGRFALTGDEDGAVVLWDIRQEKAVRTFQDQWVQDVVLSPDYRWAYAVGGNGLSRWDLRSGTLNYRYAQERISAISLSQCGEDLAALVRNNTILVWSQIPA